MTSVLTAIDRLRLPRWALGSDWPVDSRGAPALARLDIQDGRIGHCRPCRGDSPDAAVPALDAGGALALPGLVDAHVHLDKTFTAGRVHPGQPGLLGAIDAVLQDRAHWTAQDIRRRAAVALEMAWQAGVTRLRTHVDWWESADPLAWSVLGELAAEWAGKIRLERVALIPQPFFEDPVQARRLARHIAASGTGALLGGFIHSHHWNAAALENLLCAGTECGLGMDLHVDEELNAAAQGLVTIAATLGRLGAAGRVVCGHVCALAAFPERQALETLDAVARVPITLVALPLTNLLLQDARPGRTPRLRGITLVKEARERGIPVLIASDNVEDPFCRLGSYDPVDALAAGVLAAQLPDAFDEWSQAICRADWLDNAAAAGWDAAPPLEGRPADMLIFPQARLHSWPARTQNRIVVRAGARQSAASTSLEMAQS